MEPFIQLPPRNSSVDFRCHGYEVIAFVGGGRFGNTFRVRRLRDSSIWLAKMIDLTYQDDKSRRLSLQEAELMKGLEHPSVVQCVESFIHEDVFLVIVMEYCEGGDLLMYLSSLEGALIKEEEILHWFSQLVGGLQYIHSKSILHRDLKPSNIFLGTDGNIKIGDFGISRVLSSTMAAADTTIGTPQYMPPEICENKPYTYKSDIWSLGCVIYEMCAQENAFSGDSLRSLVMNINYAPVKPISKFYSEQLWSIISKMLAKKPCERPRLCHISTEISSHRMQSKYLIIPMPSVRTANPNISCNDMQEMSLGNIFTEFDCLKISLDSFRNPISGKCRQSKDCIASSCSNTQMSVEDDPTLPCTPSQEEEHVDIYESTAQVVTDFKDSIMPNMSGNCSKNFCGHIKGSFRSVRQACKRNIRKENLANDEWIPGKKSQTNTEVVSSACKNISLQLSCTT